MIPAFLFLLSLLSPQSPPSAPAGTRIDAELGKGTVIRGELTAALPKGTVVVINILRLQEVYEGGTLTRLRSSANYQRYGRIDRDKASAQITGDVLCDYAVDGVFDPEVQSDEIRKRLKKEDVSFQVSARLWSGCSPEGISKILKHAARLKSILPKVDPLVTRAESALRSKETWEKEGGEALLHSVSLLNRELEVFHQEVGLTAAPFYLDLVIQDLSAILRYAKFTSTGERDTTDYHTGGIPTSARGEAQTLESVRKGLLLVPDILRREVALYIPKCLRAPLKEWASNSGARGNVEKACQELKGLVDLLQSESDPAVVTAVLLARRLSAPPKEGETESAVETAALVESIEAGLRKFTK